jgi:tetratricopeptide (TPR) repeat protein
VPFIKKVVFSFIATILIPLLFFVLLEIVLRLADVGTSFDYFHTVDIEGQAHFQENPQFADQFYPPALNIGPLENTFAEERDPGQTRVYVLGGSAAMGFPHKNHGLDRHLGALLRAALPGRRIEIINTAMTSVNSHVVYEVARSLPENSADFAVILMGNNEVVGPYGPGTFNQNFLSSLSLIRGLQALKRTRIWQALDSLMMGINPSDARQELEWEGMQMFTNFGVPHDDPRMDSVYSHYENNLRDIVDILHSKGFYVVLSSVPVNFRHSAPFSSVHAGALSDEQLARWGALSQAGSRSLAERDWDGAIASLEAALAIDPDYADTHFQLATAYENKGAFEQSATHYARALDLDALRFRADTRINEIIQDVAASIEHDAFDFVDSAAAFERESQPFQPGWNLLVEHVHYDFSGNYILAAGISRAILGNVPGVDDYRPVDAGEVGEIIGYPNHETIDVMKNLQGMVRHPPFTGQSNYSQLEKFVSKKIDSVTVEVGSPAEVIRRRQRVVDAGLADWKLHFELAELNRYLGNREAMYRHLNAIFSLYPHNRDSYMKMADAMSKDGKWREVIPYLERSLYYTRGDEKEIAETLGWLGTAHFKIGEREKATELLLEIPANYPEQIGLTLRAYGNLVKYASEAGKTRDVERYREDVQEYARSLIRQGKDKDYPLLYRRMAQIMTSAGDRAAAAAWAEARPQH